MKRLAVTALTLVLVVVSLIAFLSIQFLNSGSGSRDEKVIVEVPRGTSFQTVARELARQGLVSDAFKLRLYARFTGLDQQIKVGEYQLNRGMTPGEILGVLVSGKSIQYPVTIPEGTNSFEIADLLESKGFFKAQDFLAAVRNPQQVKKLLGEDLPSLEGYLYPETYLLTKYTTLDSLLGAMVQNFNNVYQSVGGGATGGPLSLPRHELVTLASIVEKETGAASERPQIASVFYNRLNQGMKLQSDPTIIFGIWMETGKYKNNITRDDILRSTDYNTYTVPRLPRGPIGSPGRDALQAVLKPDQTEFVYFVSRNDGTHVFTKTYEEHQAAVKSFQLNPNARKGKSWRDLGKASATVTAPASKTKAVGKRSSNGKRRAGAVAQ